MHDYDRDYVFYVAGELPFDRYLAVGNKYVIIGGFWSRVGKGFKKAAKTFYKKVLKNKWVQRVALLAAATAANVFAPGSGVALIAAVAIIKQATSKDKKKAAEGTAKIKEIHDKALTGDPAANDALSALKAIRESQKEAAGEIIDESKVENKL